MAGIKWTNEENKVLINSYQTVLKDNLMKLFPTRTWEAIKIQGMKLGLKRGLLDGRNSSLSILLEDTHESYYWIGFLMADGSINKNRLKLGLAKLDKEHLINFSKYIKSVYKEEKRCYSTSAMDSFIIPKIMQKFEWNLRKTYNPPSDNIFNKFNDDLFLSFLSGFIDGDGCIKKIHKRTDCSITIKLHSSWLNILKEIEKRISKIYNIDFRNELSKINNRGYAVIHFSNHKVINYLKMHVEKYKLPVLKRKWDLIDINRKFKGTFDEFKNRVLYLYNKNYTKTQIAIELKVSPGYVSRCFSQEKAV